MVFDKEWFIEYQRALVRFANTKFGRHTLRIGKDIPKDKKVIGITPDSITWLESRTGDSLTVKTDFRTHDKFAKRFYYAFKPFWYTVHFVDWVFSFSPTPKLEFNFGFDTLTEYPAVGANSPVDGFVKRTGTDETFSTIRDSAGTVANDTDIWGPAYHLIGGTTSGFDDMARAIYLFDTSALSGVINSATLSLHGDYKENSLVLSDSEAGVAVVGATPASDDAIVAADYQETGSTRFATDILYSSFVLDDYNVFTFNGSGLTAISKTGLSKFGTRSAIDFDDGTPNFVSGAETSCWVKFADNAGTASDPKLIVEYTISVSKAKVIWF